MSKMLIVDDEEKIRAVVREYAEFEDFEVTEARDGMEAVALCRENDYDIIIMDVMMPRLFASHSRRTAPSPSKRSIWKVPPI